MERRPAPPDASNAGDAPAPKKQRQRAAVAPTNQNNGIAWCLGEVRQALEGLLDVEGVKEQLDQFPECVLLGSIAARRELIAALLGKHAHATAAAAQLCQPGTRQPVALELRCTGGDDSAVHGPEADAWLQSVSQAAAAALGSRLKVEPYRMRLSSTGCTNLDVMDLPDRPAANGTGVPPKIEEMRIRYLGSRANLLVCLEPGQPLEFARRFDPQRQRTVLLGAATDGADSKSASTLCGPEAARELEERFAALCHERAPQWLSSLGRLETRLAAAHKEASEIEHTEDSTEVLRRAQAAGVSFGRAFQHVIGGTPGCGAGARTLEEELAEFAAAAAAGQCSVGKEVSGALMAEAAAEVFAAFDGVEGYAAYLRDTVGIPGGEVPLNGGAAWHRLLMEIEVAVRLAHPRPEELAALTVAAVQAGGTGVHGHQRWDDVAGKLLLTIAFEPLRRRIHYVAARVAWTLRQQKETVSEWMAALGDGPAARMYSPLFPQHLALLRSSPITRSLVFGAFDKAADCIANTLRLNLESTLSAGCMKPDLMLRPRTLLDLEPVAPVPKSGRATAGRSRVIDEMRHRSGPSGGLPTQLRDRVFEPREATQALPYVELRLRRAFSVLANALANQAYAFSETSLDLLCRRDMDEAMNAVDFSPEQKRAVAARHAELTTKAGQLDERLSAVRRCTATLRSGGNSKA